jgi:hypothetical protein
MYCREIFLSLSILVIQISIVDVSVYFRIGIATESMLILVKTATAASPVLCGGARKHFFRLANNPLKLVFQSTKFGEL